MEFRIALNPEHCRVPQNYNAAPSPVRFPPPPANFAAWNTAGWGAVASTCPNCPSEAGSPSATRSRTEPVAGCSTWPTMPASTSSTMPRPTLTGRRKKSWGDCSPSATGRATPGACPPRSSSVPAENSPLSAACTASTWSRPAMMRSSACGWTTSTCTSAIDRTSRPPWRKRSGRCTS